MAKGVLITFEGPEGSGKSTQAGRLKQTLIDQGLDVVCTREPGGTPVGERIRDILLYQEAVITPVTELLLYVAARAQNTKERIIPALTEGKVVICDRYHDSSVAYQGYGRGLPLADVKRLNALALQGVEPDLTFLMDIDPEIGLKRVLGNKWDRLEQEDISFHRMVREGYLEMSSEPRFVVLSAIEPVAVLHKRILMRVLDLLCEKRRENHETCNRRCP